VLIQEYNKDFLPNYLRFVDGVVDSEDLPLNVARESIQTTRAIKRIGASIKGKLLAELERLAKEEADRYQQFWKEFGVFIKEGIATEPGDADRLAKLLRFHSSVSDGEHPTVTLDDYVARMKDDQDQIYYILVDDLKSVAHSPHLDTFRAHELEVLYLTETVDSFMLMNLHDYEGKPLRNVDDASLELPQVESESDEPPLEQDAFERLRGRFAEVLGDRVSEVRASKMLTESPIRLATPEGQLDRNVQRVYRMLEREYKVPQKILELNPRHPLLHNLAAMLAENTNTPLVDEVIEQLYESALLLDGIHPNPAEMVPRLQKPPNAATPDRNRCEPVGRLSGRLRFPQKYLNPTQ
jgi:molecular chaperone HtpG